MTDNSEKILEEYHRKGIRHIKAVHEEGPVLIIGAEGVYPNNLDRAVKEQADYYRRKAK